MSDERPTIYLNVADAAAWQALAVAAWGAHEDGSPAKPRVVTVDGPWQTISVDAVIDDDGNVVTPAVLHDDMAVNLIATAGYAWPDDITAASRPAPANPQRIFPQCDA